MLRTAIIPIFMFLATCATAQDILYITGQITDKISGEPIEGAHITVQTSRAGITSDEKGTYLLKVVRTKNLSIKVSHIGFGVLQRSVRSMGMDTVHMDFALSISPELISPVEITARSEPITIYGSLSYCVADFEFYGDKFLLLTYASRDQKSSSLMLRDKNGDLLLSAKVPGNAVELYQDYEDRYYVICDEQVFRIMIESALMLLVPMSIDYFEANIKPGIDMMGEKIIFSDYKWNRPSFKYYTVWKYDTEIEELASISDAPLTRMYRFEYYYLNNAQRVAAWKLADKFGVDQHEIAAYMTGFQNSFYFEELYAPMFVVDDTALIFDHYANKLYRYDKMNRAVDSVDICYHKSRGSMKWKKELVKDDGNDEIYALFQKNGYYYLNAIDTEYGKLKGAFKMSDKYAEKMKIKDNFVYYVYDPQDRYQTPFLYKERIQL